MGSLMRWHLQAKQTSLHLQPKHHHILAWPAHKTMRVWERVSSGRVAMIFKGSGDSTLNIYEGLKMTS